MASSSAAVSSSTVLIGQPSRQPLWAIQPDSRRTYSRTRDAASGVSAGFGLNAAGGLVTVSLAIDFLGVAKPGQWLEFATAFAKRGKTLCFAQLFVTADGETVARANATFRVIGA